jgi:RimJ/RimL family protein N-acetyltransferase
MSPPEVGFIAIDRNCAALIAQDPDEFDKLLEVDSIGVRDQLKSVIDMTPAALLDADEWGTYFAYDAPTRRIVGACGYKASPTPAGTVEIAYFTFPAYEGQGFATGMVSALVARAVGSIDVGEVIAHTLPQKNASTRVMEKSAFVHTGDHVDPEDGPVWRWRYGP